MEEAVEVVDEVDREVEEVQEAEDVVEAEGSKGRQRKETVNEHMENTSTSGLKDITLRMDYAIRSGYFRD